MGNNTENSNIFIPVCFDKKRLKNPTFWWYDKSVPKEKIRKRCVGMNRNIRIVLSAAIYFTGFIVSLYVGGWIMFLKPVRHTIAAYTLGTLTLSQLLVAVVKCVSSMTVAGLIWCLGYMASNHIYDSRDEKMRE